MKEDTLVTEELYLADEYDHARDSRRNGLFYRRIRGRDH